MIVMIVIGWVVVLPLLVVSGLYLASTVLGRRARGGPPVEVGSVESAVGQATPPAIAGERLTAVAD